MVPADCPLISGIVTDRHIRNAERRLVERVILSVERLAEEAKVPLPRAIRIRVISDDNGGLAAVDSLHALFVERKGQAKVLFDVERAGDFMVVMEADGYNVVPDRNFIARVEQLCGRGSVRIIS